MSPPSRAIRNPEQGGRWLIFGGTFDPVHRGHIRLAEDARRAWPGDGVLFVLSARPPHRPEGPAAPFEDRLAMLRRAVAPMDRAVVSTIERELSAPNYTLHTVRELKRRYPECEFAFLIGADHLPQLPGWHQPLELLKEVEVLVGSRPGYPPRVPDTLPSDRIRCIETGLLDISSTQIRKAVQAGADREALADLVPPTVADYILSRNLYR